MFFLFSDKGGPKRYHFGTIVLGHSHSSAAVLFHRIVVDAGVEIAHDIGLFFARKGIGQRPLPFRPQSR